LSVYTVSEKLLVGGWVAGGRRRVSLGVVAAVAVAGVAVASLEASSAQAAGGRSGSSGGGHGAGHGVRGVPHGDQHGSLNAKRQTLSALIDQGREAVQTLDVDTTQKVISPRALGYTPTTSAAVEEAFKVFLRQPLPVQEGSHLMVIAYQPAEPGEERPRVRFFLPSLRQGGPAVEYIDSDADLSVEEATLTLEDLGRLENAGFRFYSKTGTFLRPLQASTAIWWPAGERYLGKTRGHIDAQLAKDTVNAQILDYLYRPDVHDRMLTAKDVTSVVTVFRDNKYDKNKSADVTAISSRLIDLVNFGLIKDRGKVPGATGSPHQYSALTADEILARDTMSIEQRLDIFAPPTSSSKRREIAVHLRDNPRQVFDMDRLMEAVPGLKKGYAAATLQLMSDAGLIKQVEAGVRSRVQAKYRLSS
jgi:hypothetical protein